MLYGVANGSLEVVDASAPAQHRGSGVAGSSIPPKNVKKSLLDVGANDLSYLGYSRPSILDQQYAHLVAEEGVDSKLIHENVDGVKWVCRPNWPNYYERSLQGRAKHPVDNPTDYLDALEFRRDDTGEIMMPHKYRIRYRMGRGNRLIADKIPVYRNVDDDDDEAEISEDIIRYQYPTQLRPMSLANTRPTVLAPSVAPVLTAGALSAAAAAGVKSVNGVNGHLLNHHHNNTMGKMAASSALAPSDFMTNHHATVHHQPKPLPELPHSNRRALHQARKYAKVHAPNYVWSSSTVPAIAYLPPAMPTGPVAVSLEQQEKLLQILNGPDSEDEDVLVDRSDTGEIGSTFSSTFPYTLHPTLLKSLSLFMFDVCTEFARIVQKHAEILHNAAQQAAQNSGNSKKSQHVQPKVKLSMEV